MNMVSASSVEQRIFDIISPSVQRLGYDIIRIKIIEAGRRRILQIMLEFLDGKEVNVEDCKKVSRHLSTLLDVEDPLEGAYNLEVSSAGVDRPLTRIKDFTRFVGEEVSIETKELINGQKRFKGILEGIKDDDKILVTLSSLDINDTITANVAEIVIPFISITKAKLVF